MIHKAKTPRCAALDKAVYGLSADLAVTIPTYVAMQEIRAPHSFYRGSNRFIYDGVPMFHRDVSIASRNNLAVTRLALVWAIDHAGA